MTTEQQQSMVDAYPNVSHSVLQAEQTRLLYARNPLSLFTSVLIAAILVAVQQDMIGARPIIVWFTLLVATLVVRAAITVAYRRALPANAASKDWLTRFRISAAATGIAWGLASFLLFPAHDTPHQAFLTIAVAGMTAGAMASLSIDLVAALAFIVPALVPLIVRLFAEGEEIPVAMGAMIALYLGFLSLSVRRAYINVRENICLRFEAVTREQRTRLSEERLNRAQQVAHLGSFEWNPVSGDLQWSDEHFRLWGLEPQSVTPSYALFREGIHPDDVAQVEELVQQALHGGRFYDCEHRVRWPDGSEWYIHGRGEVAFDDAGQAIRMVGTVQDVTGHKQVEEARQEALDRLQKIASRVPGLVYQFRMRPDGSFCFPFASEAAREIFRLSPEEMRDDASKAFAYAHPDDLKNLLASIQASARDLTPWSHEFRARFDDGTVRWLFGNSMPQREADGSVLWHGFITDITGRKQAEEMIILSRDEAKQANQAKSRFLSSMSHELRTPLNAVIGFSQLLATDDGASPEQADLAGEVLKAGQHLLRLVEDILDLSKIEEGQSNLRLETVNLSMLISDALPMMQSMARRQGIALTLDIPAQTDYYARADITRTRQVLLNLVSNAIKYNKPHGQVAVTLKADDQRVYMRVRDTGLGIPPERVSDLFIPFARLGLENSNIEGTGIGLALARKLVELMGGEIGVESVLGQGSTFWVALPREKDAAPDDGVQPAQPEKAAPTTQRKVLCVEDNLINMKLMRDMIKRIGGWETLAAATAESGLEMASAQLPDLILMDINLPGMDGYAALARLRSLPGTAGIPVYAVTANAMKGDVRRGQSAGFDGYITKPFKLEDIRGILETVSAEKRLGH